MSLHGTNLKLKWHIKPLFLNIIMHTFSDNQLLKLTYNLDILSWITLIILYIMLSLVCSDSVYMFIYGTPSNITFKWNTLRYMFQYGIPILQVGMFINFIIFLRLQSKQDQWNWVSTRCCIYMIYFGLLCCFSIYGPNFN